MGGAAAGPIAARTAGAEGRAPGSPQAWGMGGFNWRQTIIRPRRGLPGWPEAEPAVRSKLATITGGLRRSGKPPRIDRRFEDFMKFTPV